MISLIVAIGPDKVMATKTGLPWNIHDDMVHFRNYTKGKTVIMGKTTYLTLGKPLPNRTNIVVCNDDPSFKPEGVIVRDNLFDVLKEYKNKDEELVVIGGAMIYKLALPYCDKLIISHIKKHYDGVLFFPDFEDKFYVESWDEYDEFTVKYYYRKKKLNIFHGIRKLGLPILRLGGFLLFNYPKMKRYGKHPEKYPLEKRYEYQWKIYERITKACRIHIHYEGIENMPEDSFFMVSNHQGFFDPFIAAKFKNNHFVSIAKEVIADFPFVGWVAKSTNTIFLHREDLREALRVNKEAVKLMEEGRSIWMSCEGTRTKRLDKGMNPFKPGSVKPAYMAKKTIVPLVLDDTWKAFDPETKGRMDMFVKVLKPIPYEEYCNLTTKECADMLHDLIEKEMLEHRKKGYDL